MEQWHFRCCRRRCDPLRRLFGAGHSDPESDPLSQERGEIDEERGFGATASASPPSAETVLSQPALPPEPAQLPESAPPLYFYAIGDWGVASRELKATAAAMAKYAIDRPPAFILSLGDNFYPAGVDGVEDTKFQTDWQDVFLKHETLRVPWHVVLGNHDYLSDWQAQIDFTKSERNPHGGLWSCPAQNYNFTYPFEGGSLELFALDTNGCQGQVRRRFPAMQEELHEHIKNLSQKLRESSAAWKIVFGHHPMYTRGSAHGTLGSCLRATEYSYVAGSRGPVTAPGYGLEEVLVAGGVQAYLSGHEHIFQHHRARGIDNLVCGASGAEGTGFYQGENMSATVPEWVDRQYNHGFVAAAVTPELLSMSFVAADGEVFHTVEQRRRSGK